MGLPRSGQNDPVHGSRTEPRAGLHLPPQPRASLRALVGIVLALSFLGAALGLWSRWLATLASKRLQAAMRRRVFAHASRLPLHRVYQLKTGGAASLLR